MTTLLYFEGTASHSSNSSVCLEANDVESDHSSLLTPIFPTISDHIVETLNQDQTNEDSNNPGEEDFFHL